MPQMIAAISAYNGSETITAGGKELILTSLDARAPEFYPIGTVVKILIADDGKTVAAIMKPTPDEFAEYVRDSQKSGPVPINIVKVPEKPPCYKSAICPRVCEGNPDKCDVKKPGKKGKKSEGFTTAAQIKKEETMTAAEPKEDKKVEPEPLPEGWSYPAPEGGIDGIVKRTQEIAVQNEPVQVLPGHPSLPAVKIWTEEDLLLIRNIAAKNCTEPEFKLLMYLSKTYGLDPLARQIWAVKRNDNSPALIFVGRDGMLALAHRSGQFDGMQSGVVYEGEGKERKPVSAWCEVWRKDMSHSFKTSVPFSEYNTGYTVWKTNPSAMILKVSEAVTLRKAFSISGIYSPEEIMERVS